MKDFAIPDSHNTASTAPVDEILPITQMILYGLQHVLVMYAGAVAVPLVVGNAVGLPAEHIILLISADLLFAAPQRSCNRWASGSGWAVGCR